MPASPSLFDLYVVVDWSAQSTPKLGADSIWVHVRSGSDGPRSCQNHPTRAAAAAALRDLLRSHAGQRVLVGVDFSFAYPEGFAAAAGLTSAVGPDPWRATWEHLDRAVVDSPTNANNRFEVASALNAAIGPGPGPFWGTTSERHVTTTLTRTKAPGFPHLVPVERSITERHVAERSLNEFRLAERRFAEGRLAEGRLAEFGLAEFGLAEFRLTEVELRRDGWRPSSVWQLAGAGSVGSQTLTGIPVLHRLRHDPTLRDRGRVWPFETGFGDDPSAATDRSSGTTDAIVYAEIWPSELGRPDPALHPVKDAGQVLALGARLAALDASGLLGARFGPRLDPDIARTATREEGWVLRVG